MPDPPSPSGGGGSGKGNIVVVFDETHLYTTAELKRMYRTVTRNLRKRKGGSGTWFLETTTMFAPGEESMAETTYAEAEALREGRKHKGRHRLLFDHRWGNCTDLSDEAELRAALVEAFGDARAWQDLDSLVDEFYDLRNTAADSRRYFLNARTSASDAWVAAHEWEACARPDRVLRPKDLVVLGGDGSIRDDATAIVAVRIPDGHAQLLGLWEKPEGPEGDDWVVDREAVDATVSNAMKTYNVAGFYMDPAHWQDYCDRWQNEFGEKMRVKASQRRPIEWWTNRPTAMVAALERLHEAILERRVSYTPAADRAGREAALALALTRHVLNARRAVGRSGVTIRKESPRSPHKIDSAMALALAYEAYGDAVAAGVKVQAAELLIPRRIR